MSYEDTDSLNCVNEETTDVPMLQPVSTLTLSVGSTTPSLKNLLGFRQRNWQLLLKLRCMPYTADVYYIIQGDHKKRYSPYSVSLFRLATRVLVTLLIVRTNRAEGHNVSM